MQTLCSSVLIKAAHRHVISDQNNISVITGARPPSGKNCHGGSSEAAEPYGPEPWICSRSLPSARQHFLLNTEDCIYLPHQQNSFQHYFPSDTVNNLSFPLECQASERKEKKNRLMVIIKMPHIPTQNIFAPLFLPEFMEIFGCFFLVLT